MNKRILRSVCAVLAISLTAPSFAAATDTPTTACTTQGTYVAFYNGVWNSYSDALAGMGVVRARLGQTHNGDHMRYELMYNPTNGVEDLVQTFEQRLAEQDTLLANRWEMLWDVLAGRTTESGMLATLGDVFSGLKGMVTGFSDYLTAKTVSTFASLIANPPTASDYAEQTQRLQTMTLEGKKVLLVAHSQGNLFMNTAYSYLSQLVTAGRVTSGSFGAVHIAPASPLLNGPHVLVPTDLVINALRVTGTVAANNASAPTFLQQKAMGILEPDYSGHELVRTYLNSQFTNGDAPLKIFLAAANQTLDGLTLPVAQATSGFFTVTLTWDHYGDVDLHAIEPDMTHVYYGNSVGHSGTLDHDDTSYVGPEHYTTSCDATRLAEGTYTIGLNNYRAPTGTLATVQLSTWDQGPILTKANLDVGVARGSSGNTSPASVMTVTVSKNPTTGRYTVTGQ